MGSRGNCRNCGAPLPPHRDVCAYCGIHRRPERPGEFGFRSHGWFWAGLLVVTVATVVLGLEHFGREDTRYEGRDWTILFGIVPSFLIPVAALWGPRRGRWVSLVFTVLPALALTAAMAMTGELHDVDMLGFPAASAASCLVATLLGSALHEWIVRVRAP